MTKKLAPMHPREVLRLEFLVPLKLSAGIALCCVFRSVTCNHSGVADDISFEGALCTKAFIVSRQGPSPS
jgi:hypothetical protein